VSDKRRKSSIISYFTFWQQLTFDPRDLFVVHGQARHANILCPLILGITGFWTHCFRYSRRK